MFIVHFDNAKIRIKIPQFVFFYFIEQNVNKKPT